MSDLASEVAESIRTLAEAIETHAAVMASVAAVEHSKDYPSQREMAEVIYTDAMTRFEELMKRTEPERRKQLSDFIDGLCKGKKK